MIGEGFREWFEAPSYEEGVGVDGEPAGSACRIGVVEKFLLSQGGKEGRCSSLH